MKTCLTAIASILLATPAFAQGIPSGSGSTITLVYVNECQWLPVPNTGDTAWYRVDPSCGQSRDDGDGRQAPPAGPGPKEPEPEEPEEPGNGEGYC